MNQYQDFAIRIGNLLLDSLAPTPSLQTNLYRGNAGLLLFYVKLYQQTKDTAYLDFIKNESKLLLQATLSQPTQNCALYTGKLGVAYVLYEVAILLDDESYHPQILQIIKSCSPTQELLKGHVNDLLSGIAGVIMALLHLHSHYQQDWMLQDVFTWYQQLLQNVQLSKTGIYFDRKPNEQSGLCGFSHGSAGIAFVFLELGYYFQNPAFFTLAELTMAHEKPYYVPKAHNWMDLRFLAGDEAELAAQYQNKGQAKRPVRSNFSAWCNGAPGTAITAYRGYQVTGELWYKEILHNALTNTQASLDRITDYSLCHGSAGNALILLNAYHHSKEASLLSKVNETAQHLIKTTSTEEMLQDHYKHPKNSLLLGAAGLGYFLLALQSPQKTDQVLAPTLSSSFNGTHAYFSLLTQEDLWKELYNQFYPKTMFFIKKAGLTFIPEIPGNDHFRESFHLPIVPVINQQPDPWLKEVFTIEQLINQQRFGHDDNGLLAAIEKVEQKNGNHLLETAWQTTALKLSKRIKLIKTNWNWLDNHWQNAHCLEPAEHFALVISTPTGTIEQTLGEFAYWVLASFGKTGSLSEKIVILAEGFDFDTPQEKLHFETLITQQVQEALKQGLLVQA